MAEESKQKSRLWLWIGAAGLLIAVFFVARALTRDKIPVHAAKAVRAELVGSVSTNGVVEPVDAVEFHSPAATSIKAILVQQGDQIAAGKLIMQLDDVNARARVATAESGLRSALATQESVRQGGTLEERQSLTSTINRDTLDVSQKEHELQSLQKLQATGAASASEIEASRQRLALAQDTLKADQGRQQTRYSPSEVLRASSAVSDAQANLTAARSVLEKMSIRAAHDGTVYSVPVGRSDFVEEGKLLAKMANLKQLRVRAYFDEPDIGHLAIGQKSRIVWDAYPGREWHGHIILVPSTIVSYGTRNVGEVLIAIDDPGNNLLPDTHVTVTVTTSSAPNTLTIPREALHSENGKPYVFRVVNGNLERTAVVIGTPNLTQVPVTSGLNDGDSVATGSLNGIALEDGAAVKVVK